MLWELISRGHDIRLRSLNNSSEFSNNSIKRTFKLKTNFPIGCIINLYNTVKLSIIRNWQIICWPIVVNIENVLDYEEENA
jgi:hypothetical protein